MGRGVRRDAGRLTASERDKPQTGVGHHLFVFRILTHPLLATDGPPLPLSRLIAPASAPPSVDDALAAVLGVGGRAVPATLQLKANGVFVSIRGQDVLDITHALDALPAHLARLDTRREERRLVYSEGVWRIDP